MKAYINKKGHLIITGENETEEWALVQWRNQYWNNEGSATLVIELPDKDLIPKIKDSEDF